MLTMWICRCHKRQPSPVERSVSSSDGCSVDRTEGLSRTEVPYQGAVPRCLLRRVFRARFPIGVCSCDCRTAGSARRGLQPLAGGSMLGGCRPAQFRTGHNYGPYGSRQPYTLAQPHQRQGSSQSRRTSAAHRNALLLMRCYSNCHARIARTLESSLSLDAQVSQELLSCS